MCEGRCPWQGSTETTDMQTVSSCLVRTAESQHRAMGSGTRRMGLVELEG